MLKVLVPLNGYVTSQCGARHVVNEFVKNQNMEIQIFNVQAPFSGNFTGYARTPARKSFHLGQAEKTLASARQVHERFSITHTGHREVGNKADCITAPAVGRRRCDRVVKSRSRKNSLVRLSQKFLTNQVMERTTVPVELIAGSSAPSLERFCVPAGLGAGLLVLAMVVG